MTELVPADSPWKRGNPTDAVVPVEIDGPWYLETGTDIWFVYLQKALIAAEAYRTVEQFGYAVVLERRDRYTLEDAEAGIVGVDLSRSEAEQMLLDFFMGYENQDQLERMVNR